MGRESVGFLGRLSLSVSRDRDSIRSYEVWSTFVVNSQTVYTRDSFVFDETSPTFARAKSPDAKGGMCGSRFNFHDRAPYTLVDATDAADARPKEM